MTDDQFAEMMDCLRKIEKLLTPKPKPLDARKMRKIFRPPTIEEVKKYCAERKNKVDPKSFWDFYDTRDWRLKGGDKMSKWKSAIHTWENSDRVGVNNRGPLGRRVRKNVKDLMNELKNQK